MAYRTEPLQADPTKLEFRLLNIDINRPPHVPPVTMPFRELEPYTAYISGVMADEIQQHAEDNDLRRYMFNMAADRNFANAYFDAMVLTAIDMAAWLFDSQNMGPQEAVETAAVEICRMTAAVNCRDYDELWNYVDRSVQRDVEDTIGEFDELGRTIQQWKRQAGIGGGRSGGSNRGGTYQGPRRGTGGGQARRGGGSTYSNAVSTSQAEADVYSRRPSRDSAPARRGNQRPVETRRPAREQREPEPRQEEVVEPALTEIACSIKDWVRSKDYPYFLAYEPNKTVATLVIQPDGTTVPNYRMKDESEMNYEDHATPNAFGNTPPFVDLSNAARSVENIRKGIQRINKEAAIPAAAPGEVQPLKISICKDWVGETSLESVILQAQIRRLQNITAEGKPDVYRVYGSLMDTIITQTNEGELIDQLAKCKTFTGLREKLLALGGEMSLELYNTINRRMTELVNRKINLEMGILKPTTNNFAEDIVDLVELLEKKGGTIWKSGFLKDQQADIQRIMRTLTPEFSLNQTDEFLGGLEFPEGTRPTFTYLYTGVSVTFLDCTSYELGVELGEDGIPARVTKELTPVFYDLVKGIFTDAPNFADNTQTTTISRFLVRTNDGRLMEATKGSLVEEAYLLTVIK